MRRVHVGQTYLGAHGRQLAGRGLGPLDEADRVLEVRLEVAPLGRGHALEAEEIEVRDVRVAWIAIADGEGRARHVGPHPERAASTADEGRLTAPELARDRDDVAGNELARQTRRDFLGLDWGGAPNEPAVRHILQHTFDELFLIDAAVLTTLGDQAALELLVLLHERRIGPQSIAEAEVVAPLRTAPLDDVDDHLPRKCVPFSKAAFTRAVVIPRVAVAERLDLLDRLDWEVDGRSPHCDVDCRLGREARHGGAADVLDLQHEVAERLPEHGGFGREALGPIGLVVDQQGAGKARRGRAEPRARRRPRRAVEPRRAARPLGRAAPADGRSPAPALSASPAWRHLRTLRM